MKKALVLDGNQRSALAATRSLGRRGVHVIVADERLRTLAGASRHAKERISYPSPHTHPDLFVSRLEEIATEGDPLVVFPMTEVTTWLMLQHRPRFQNACLPLPEITAFDHLTDKYRLCQLADRLGVPVPGTRFVPPSSDLSEAVRGLEFPVVLKPHRSRIWAEGTWIEGPVLYASTMAELHHLTETLPCFRDYPFLIQARVSGRGQGIFALYNQGEPVAFFAHRRLREKPPTGGVSVLSESIPVDPRLKELADKLLGHVGWHGVAMVEFKVSPDGTPYLMEVNGRFWGSLQLAIYSGVDFPSLLYDLATGHPRTKQPAYRTGVKCRWLLGDLDHLYLVLRDSGTSYAGWKIKSKAVARFLRPFQRDLHYEVNRWNDPWPFLHELREYFRGPRG